MLNALKPIDMAILYDWYENPGTNEEAPEERGLHPRPLLNGKVTMRQLYNRVHARSSLTVGDVMNAIDCLAQICGEELRDGHEVHIEGAKTIRDCITDPNDREVIFLNAELLLREGKEQQFLL